MVILERARSMLLLLAAGSLAACASTLPRSVTIVEGQLTTFALQIRNGPLLTLQNESSGYAIDVYSETDDPLRKVVPDTELQALLDVMTAEQLFALSLPRVPGDARDVLRLEQDGRTWIWARRGSATDPREAAFGKSRNYFMALYNGNTAYHSAPDEDNRPDFETEAERVRREAEAARQRLKDREQKQR